MASRAGSVAGPNGPKPAATHHLISVPVSIAERSHTELSVSQPLNADKLVVDAVTANKY